MNSHQILALGVAAFNQDEPRDDHGRWSESDAVPAPPFAGPTRIGRGGAPPRSEYDETSNKEIRDYLRENGFKATGTNTDQHKPVIYSKHIEEGGDEAGGGFNGQSTHTLIVYPNGEWEHSSETSHGGTGVATMHGLRFEPGANFWPGRQVAARRRR